MADIRIKDITGTATSPAVDDYLPIDGIGSGTRKILASSLANPSSYPSLVLAPDGSPTYAAGKLVYDSSNNSLTFFNGDSNVALQVGQEDWVRVINNTGVTIANGTPVYLNGASAGLPTIALARADALATTNAVGLTTESIANGGTGFVTTMGAVRGVNTAAFAVGPIYLSATTAGVLTQTVPAAPNFKVAIGYVAVVNASTGVIVAWPSTPLPLVSTNNSVRRTNFSKINGWGIASSGASGNFTFACQTPAETAYTHVRVVMWNTAATASTWGFTAVASAPTSGNDGTALTWLPVYFDAPASSERTIGLFSGTTRSVTIPAAIGSGNATIPSFVYSNWVAINSVARSDGGTKPLLQLRSWETAGVSAFNIDTGSQGQYNTQMVGREILSQIASDTDGSRVTSAASYGFTLTTSGWMPPVFIEFRSAVQVVTIATIGDSLANGQIASAPPNNKSAGWVNTAAAAISTTGVPVAYLNIGYSGNPAGSFRETARTIRDNLVPSILVVSGGSPNDGLDRCGDNLADIIQAVTTARAAGTQVVLTTIAPFGAGDTTANLPRTAANNQIKSLGTLGIVDVLDLDLILRDPGNFNNLLAGYNSGDNIHWTQSGQTAVSTAAATLFSAMIAR